MEVNLSRAHHMAKSAIEEYYRLSERLGSMRTEFVFRIFEKTQESDYESFCRQLAKRKEEYRGLVKKMRNLLGYSDYLKISLARANEELGINARLCRLASLGREIAQLQSFIGKLEASHAPGLEAVQQVDYYKSAFTEQNRIFDLAVYLYDENDLSAFRAELRKLLAKRQTLNDELATINQNNILSVMTLDEFEKGADSTLTL